MGDDRTTRHAASLRSSDKVPGLIEILFTVSRRRFSAEGGRGLGIGWAVRRGECSVAASFGAWWAGSIPYALNKVWLPFSRNMAEWYRRWVGRGALLGIAPKD